MPEFRWGARAVVLGTAVALLLLLFPFRIPAGEPFLHSLGASAHVLLFAALALLWRPGLPRWARGAVLWIGLALLAAMIEWIQPALGRSAEAADWWYGAAGAACICLTGRLRSRIPLRVVVLLTLSLLPVLWAMAMWQMEVRAFPMLADPGAVWTRRNWVLNGVQRPSITKDGFVWKATVRERPEILPAYPGVFRAPAHSDWRRIHSFNISVFWPVSSPAVFAVRVDDQPYNPPYAERFQKEFSVTQGWNSIRIPVDELRQTPGGRRLDLAHITQWGVFLVSDIPLDYFHLGAVRLELQKEYP